MRVILVPVSDRPECVVALREAFYIGKRLDSTVIGCHIKAHREPDASTNDPDSKKIVDESKNAKKTFKELVELGGYKLIKKQKNKPGAVWLEKVGSPNKIFSINGPVSDLIIVSRPSKEGKSLAKTFMMTAILNSARPVIILPQLQSPPVGKRVCIAWNQSHQAALAVAAALPLLRKAKKVNIITCGPENKTGPKSTHLINYLKSWDIKAKRVVATGKDDAQAILNGFNETQSDLLVMGGYSRGRLKQRIFGGVTQYMLNQANIPVFMLHTG